MADSTYVPTFTNDISPMFAQYRDRMTWRLDLCKYEDVVENKEIISKQISEGSMPPANQGTLSQQQIDLFETWKNQDPPKR